MRHSRAVVEHEEEIDERRRDENQQRLLETSPATLIDWSIQGHEPDGREADREPKTLNLTIAPRKPPILGAAPAIKTGKLRLESHKRKSGANLRNLATD